MRLRLAPVECKRCGTDHCGNAYEGEQCPRCRQPFDPTRMRKELYDRLILVDVDPPIYKHTQRCRCTECKSLYDLREDEVRAYAHCDQCKKPLFRREQLQKVWQGAKTLLQRARQLDRARRQLPACPRCASPVPVVCWCPLSHSIPHSARTNGLPQNPVAVWIRTFHVDESLEELQVREWGGRAGETDIEVENETAEINSYGEG